MLKQNTTTDNLRMNKALTESKASMRLRKAFYPLLMQLPKVKIRYRLTIINNFNPLPNHPIIFAANHSAFPDIPLALRAIGRHSYVLIGTQRLAAEDTFFFLLNGTIWVDRKDKTDRQAVKQVLIDNLKNGCSILWFPEGTWNLTENLPMLPMKWGIIDVARAANAQIIPMAMDYDREQLVCNVKFGKPLFPPENHKDGINILRNSLASLRWELWEQHDDWVSSRQTIEVEKCRQDLMLPLGEYPLLQWDYEQSIIYHPQTAPDEAFAFMDKLIPSKANAFLFREKH